MSSPRGSSRGWRARQEKDPFVQRARAEGWRSRAVFKLEELLQKGGFLRPGLVCVDLGAAPGGWSQYIVERLKQNVEMVAVDILPMDALPQVRFVQGDFREQAVLDQVLESLGARKADLVISDMAPNITGTKAIDQPRSMYLAELALDFAGSVLRPGGGFICKLFQGADFDEYVRAARQQFSAVRVIKPEASRRSSSEVYLLARNYRMV